MPEKKSLVIKSDTKSRQESVQEDRFHENDKIIEPYLNYASLRGLYAFNVYHQRALKLKAMLLSQIESTTLDKHLPKGVSAKKFLYKFMLNAETYGSAFFEKASATATDFNLYNLNTHNARVDKYHNIFQVSGRDHIPLEGGHFMYDTILSDHYGEPDYVATISQIITLYKADQRNALFFDNGAKPEMAIIFEDSDPSDEQIQAITQFFKKDFKGYANSHKTLVLTTGEGSGENKPSIRVEDMSKIEDMSHEKLKKVGRDEIIAAHGVPPRIVGVVDPNALGGGGELVSQLHMFNQVTIMPKMEMVESFFKEHGIDLKLKTFDATAFKDDADVVTGLVAAGILTSAEAKNILGWANGNQKGA